VNIAASRAAIVPSRAVVEDFLFHEVHLLDTGRYEEWVDLFTPDGEYWVPAVWQQPDPLDHLSLFYEDRNLMKVRMNRLRHHGTTTMQPPSRTVHQVGNVMVEAGEGALVVHSNLLCAEYRLDRQRLFAALVRHDLRPGGAAGFQIHRKRVDLINCDTDAGHVRVNIPF
jgi:3-phenylpropionate/cinnamic acid dioxygenase small subunit